MTALRKLIALLALTFSVSALAQTAEPPKTPLYSIYGTLNVNLQYTEAGDATAGSASDVSGRFAVSSDSTNIGIRGGLDVAHGLKVVYQCETAAVLDTPAAGLCGRNSRVGLSGNYGTLFYGNWDTPFKAGTYGTKADDPFGNTDVFGYQGIMSSPGYNARSGGWTGAVPADTATPPFRGVHSFDLRAGNSVAYWTPKFSGLSAKFQYSTEEFRSANGTITPMLAGAVVNYDMGGLSLVASGEYHEDGFGIRVITAGANTGTQNSRDMAWRLAAGYELPLGVGALTVMGMFEQLLYEQEDAVAGFSDYDRLAWLVGAKFRTGNHELRARYSQALDPEITAATGTTLAANAEDELAAMQFALGYAYHLAKSTQVYAFYTQILNDDRAQYTLTIGGAPGMGGGTPAGADPMAAGLGIRYAF
jgi:predicted porin